MSEPFLGEIRILSCSFAPKGWALCDGRVLPISQNQALFSLLGNTYGGDGQTTFALPDLRGRVPIHVGNGHTLGQAGGERWHALVAAEVPSHTHTPGLIGTTADADRRTAAGARPAVGAIELYAKPDVLVSLHPQALTGNTGGNQPHDNMQPSLALNFVIALQGIFPPRS